LELRIISSIFLEKQLYLKSLESKNVFNWSVIDMPKEMFEPDKAFILSDIDIYNAATKQNLSCEILINPGKYMEHYSISAFAYQKDFALKEILDYHLQKFKQGIVKLYFLKRFLTDI
jgi:hypothetical protein